jgi:carbonic anhydrase
VRWTVFDEPIRISRAQIEQFARIFPPNARPIQPLNRRYLLHANL